MNIKELVGVSRAFIAAADQALEMGLIEQEQYEELTAAKVKFIKDHEESN